MATMIDSPLFGDLFSTEEMRRIFSDETTIQRWMDVEAALARAEAKLGIIAQEAADEITRKCRVELIDMAEMKRQLVHTHHPIVPLIRCYQKICDPAAGELLHWGATTQDIMDTGAVLQLKDANAVVVRDLTHTLELLKDLASRHKHTIQAGRTHGQQALPITFGYKVAVWAAEVKRHLQRIEQMSARVFQGQFGGAVGTLASIGEPGLRLQELMFADLDLAVPEIAWHTARDGLAELVCVYAMIGGTLAKMMNEVVTLQRSEIAELEEPFHMGKVGSSTMPHKRNPMMSEGVIAVSRLLAMQVGPALATMQAEHERDHRGWQSEWSFLPESCCMLGGMLFWTNKVLAGLQVSAESMQRNLEVLHGLLLSENVMLALGSRIGRQEAHEVAYELCMEAFEKRVPLKGLLMHDVRVSRHLTERQIDELLDPARYTGLSAQFVERVTGNA
ncbi:MAG: adenylosuccinate lyase [Burkholderiales bacterium]|nr:adenylosuccinate lyase [Burkholderiales bacterium]